MNARPDPNVDPRGMQIFKVERTNLSGYFPRKLREWLLIQHIDDIIRVCVFGAGDGYPEGSPYDYDPIIGHDWPTKPKFMAGFIAQKHRLPTENDKVEIQYLEGNGIKRWLNMMRYDIEYDPEYPPMPAFAIVSECKLVVN